MKRTTANLLILALALLVALALANLVQNMEALTLGETSIEFPPFRITPGVGAGFLVLVWLLSIVGLTIVLVAYLRSGPKKGKFRVEGVLPILLALVFLLAIVAIFRPPGDVAQEEEQGAFPPGADSGNQGEATTPLDVLQEALPTIPGTIALLMAFLAIAGIYLLIRFLNRRRAAAEGESVLENQELKRRMTVALEERIYGLRLGEDVRSAILGAYRDMVDLFHASGLKTGKHQTAREVEALALRRLELSGAASDELRRRFEEARYSPHPLRDEDREAAIQSLLRVKQELGA